MSAQPEALRLADLLEKRRILNVGQGEPCDDAAAELRRLHAEAEAEAKDALLRQAWAVIRWQCFGECRTEGVDGLPTPSEIDAAIRQHLGQKGETG